MIETITYSTTKEYKLPEGCSHFKVTTFGGSGQNGEGKNGGKGGAGFTSGSAGGDSVAQFKSSSGTTLCMITCYGGKGGAGHV